MNNSNRLMPAKSFRIFAEEMAEKDSHILDRLMETFVFEPVIKRLPSIHLVQIVFLRKHLSHAAAREIGNRLHKN
jgi:hypothetical protein